ncbi:peptidase domain-containing ABC transporter [Lacrimispora sp.]|uniref:peptidase domain-containing ABC transporter n=1 Tax=Lacrimispora sp. TaxID=2719234 RepID=UPI0028A84507|nr:peptidase domain-containing ABC transporter [Lacrimispora sp.]
MSKIKFMSSYEHSECGLVCVAMILDFYIKEGSLTELREHYGVPIGGFNVSQMVEILSNYGVPSKAIKVSDISILNKINEPFIAYWNANHFVVVEKIKNNKVVIVDPAKGKSKITINEFKKSFSNIVICTEIIEKKCKRKKLKNNFLLKAIKESSKPLIFTTFFSFLLQILTLFIPIYIKKIIDNYKYIENYKKIFLVMTLVILFYFSFSIIKVRIITIFQNNFDRALTSKTISHLMKLPLKFFVNRGKGEIIFTINSNQYIRAILSSQMISLFIDVVFLFFYLLLMLFYSIKLSLLTVIIGIILVSISIINTKIIIKKNQTQLNNITEVQNITGEIVNNISTIKAIGAEDEIFQRWSKGYERQLKMEKEKAHINSVLGNIPSTIQITYSLIIFVVGIMLGNKENLSIGTIVAFNALGASFLAPMLSIANSYLQLSAVKIYINQLLDIIDSKTENGDVFEEDIKLKNGNICLNHVFFKYDYFSDFVINDINMDLHSGKKIALVGASGSGKSTLFMLIAGFFEPTKGSIYVGNENISNQNANKRLYRKQLGIVLQESKLFNGTIKDNILMGRNADTEEIEQAILNSDLEKYINTLPARLDTIISEDGNNMSGGQRQRLCIARAILKKPKLILMDEPTSSLDNISENKIMDSLFEMNSTVLVIAHRLANIKKFNKIIVMDKGKIVSMGTHEELLKNSVQYKALYEKD